MSRRLKRSITASIPGIREPGVRSTSCEQPTARPNLLSSAGAIAYNLYEMFNETEHAKRKVTDDEVLVLKASTMALSRPQQTTNFTNYLERQLAYNGLERKKLDWGNQWQILALRPGREVNGRTLLIYARRITEITSDTATLRRSMFDIEVDTRDGFANLQMGEFFPLAGGGDISEVPEAMTALQLDVEILGRAALAAASRV